MEKCVNCQFYDRRNARPADGRATMWGQCRRDAPHLNPMTAKSYLVEGVWPLVRDDDWCGEWKVLGRGPIAPARVAVKSLDFTMNGGSSAPLQSSEPTVSGVGND